MDFRKTISERFPAASLCQHLDLLFFLPNIIALVVAVAAKVVAAAAVWAWEVEPP